MVKHLHEYSRSYEFGESGDLVWMVGKDEVQQLQTAVLVGSRFVSEELKHLSGCRTAPKQLLKRRGQMIEHAAYIPSSFDVHASGRLQRSLVSQQGEGYFGERTRSRGVDHLYHSSAARDHLSENLTSTLWKLKSREPGTQGFQPFRLLGPIRAWIESGCPRTDGVCRISGLPRKAIFLHWCAGTISCETEPIDGARGSPDPILRDPLMQASCSCHRCHGTIA